jgi:phytoene/squalene synthetase
MTTTSIAGGSIEQAHQHCAQLTKAAAANFYYGIALLPPSKRRAMCAVYAFARRIDDIGDGELPADQKLHLLEQQRAALGSVPDGAEGQDLVAVALADAHRRFGLPLDALEDLIDGVQMDVEEVSYQSFDDLVLYCRRVAGSIGRLSLAIFGAHDLESAWMLADDLGVAMQLTNILRDLREDAQRGRVYLPSDDLVRYHLHDEGAIGDAQLLVLAGQGAHAEESVVAGFGGGDVGQLFALMRFQALRAHDWFHRGMALVPLLDRRSAACVMAMTGIYRRLLWRIQDHPDRSLAARMSLPARSKAVVAVGSVLRPRKVPERHPAERVL